MDQKRFRSSSALLGERQVPSARTMVITFMAIFITVSMTVLVAGRMPVAPTSYAQPTGIVYREVQKESNAELSSYGWVDKSQQKVHIPIEQAMKLIMERGLPTRPQP